MPGSTMSSLDAGGCEDRKWTTDYVLDASHV